jgi:RsmE family RNA methyltransferase
VNIVLFEPGEAAGGLPLSDLRAHHVLTVLRRTTGDSFDAGLIDGPRGKATVLGVEAGLLRLAFAWAEPPPALAPLRLIVGLPRPQTARKILHDASSLGVEELQFVSTERGEPGYAQSTLWSSGEWRRHAIAGTAQAFCTRLPAIRWDLDLAAALASTPPAGARLALDNYEAPSRLGVLPRLETPATLALGSERGWSPGERERLRAAGFHFVHLGPRVLRTETALVAAVSLVLARLI